MRQWIESGKNNYVLNVEEKIVSSVVIAITKYIMGKMRMFS